MVVTSSGCPCCIKLLFVDAFGLIVFSCCSGGIEGAREGEILQEKSRLFSLFPFLLCILFTNPTIASVQRMYTCGFHFACSGEHDERQWHSTQVVFSWLVSCKVSDKVWPNVMILLRNVRVESQSQFAAVMSISQKPLLLPKNLKINRQVKESVEIWSYILDIWEWCCGNQDMVLKGTRGEAAVREVWWDKVEKRWGWEMDNRGGSSILSC